MAFTLSFRVRSLYDSSDGVVNIPVSVYAGGASVRLSAKVDTGSDYCFFERGVADALLIEPERGISQYFGTAAGSFQAWGHEVTMNTLGIEIHSLVYFFDHPHIKKNFLGRNGWLNRVRFGLVDHDSMVYLSEYDD